MFSNHKASRSGFPVEEKHKTDKHKANRPDDTGNTAFLPRHSQFQPSPCPHQDCQDADGIVGAFDEKGTLYGEE